MKPKIMCLGLCSLTLALATIGCGEAPTSAGSTKDEKPPAGKDFATFGGGCFWCIEAVFDQLKGVEKVESGYSGGPLKNPTYRQVCTGQTGHAEVVHITFDSAVVPYRVLLDVFFATHDPTTPDQQGPDFGPQYRSVIFYHSAEQKEAARKRIDELNAEKLWPAPIVTELAPFEAFYPAEAEHQQFYRNNPGNAYCRVNINPKLAKLRKSFADRLK